MKHTTSPTPVCPAHGDQLKRLGCPKCRAAYMRRRRHNQPDIALAARAKDRARARNLPFNLTANDVVVPPICPALGIPLVTGQKRSAMSPSLDRIQPGLGYVSGNVRVLSDRANRMKGDLSLPQLRVHASNARGEKRAAYLRLAAYVDRELLLAEIRAKAAQGGRAGEVWDEVARFLDRAFIRADWNR